MNRVETISRILTAQAGGALSERLDGFTTEAAPRRDKVLRMFGAKVITLTNDLDRGPYGVGEGLALKRQEFLLGKFEPLHRFKLHGEGEYQPTVTALAQGALLSLYLDMSPAETDAIARAPLFKPGDVPELTYFIPRGYLIEESRRKQALDSLTQSARDKSSYIMRPRIVADDRRGWPTSRETVVTNDRPLPEVQAIRDSPSESAA